jgi:NADPH:quinone reductase-like Zn-dependent oxidoreductase
MLFSRFKGPKYTLTYGALPDWKMMQETLIDNDIKSTIDNIYPYSEEGVEGAFKRLQSHRNRGKIVISSNEAQ